MADKLPVPTELTDSELDHVAAGISVNANNLVGVQVGDVSIANNSLNNLDIAVNAAVLSSGAQGVLQG